MLRLRARGARARRPAVRRRRASSIRRRASRSSSGCANEGSVADYLLRLRRADGTPVWVEVTATADPPATERRRARRGARPRRQRAQEARRRDARPLPPAAAGREDGGARPDDLRRRARAEQPARDDPQLGRAPVAAADARRAGAARPRDDPRANPSAPRASSATCSPSRASARRRARWSTSIRSCARRWRCAPTSSASRTSRVIDALAAGLPQVFADGHQMQQVLLNLIINAEQAMLSAQRPRHRSSCARGTTRERESVVLEINDDGPGIPEEVQPKIFDPFFTTKEVGKGTGPRPDGRLRDRAGARRAHPARVAPGRRRVVLRRAAGHGREAAAGAAAERRAERRPRPSPARRCWSSKTKPALAAAVDRGAARRGLSSSSAPATARRRSRA